MLWGRRRLKLEVSSHLGGGNWMRGAWKGCIIEGGTKRPEGKE